MLRDGNTEGRGARGANANPMVFQKREKLEDFGYFHVLELKVAILSS